MNLVIWIIFGAIAGWVADILMKSDHGLFEDVLLGVVGSFIGGLIMNSIGQPGVTGFNLYSVVVAVIGATVLIFLGRVLH